MTNLMQALFGAIAPGDLRASMISSGITGSVAAESEGLMQDYKTGHMIGSTPRLLTYMQLLAVPVGALALALIYPLLKQTYGIGGEGGLVSPTSQRWVGFAKWIMHASGAGGESSLDTAARLQWMTTSFAVGALLGVLFTILEEKQSLRAFVPSPTGIGIGMLVPASAVSTMFLGGLAEWVWGRMSPESNRKYSIPMASGFIAGEALVAVAIPLLVVAGIMSPP
jgi:uncharacterized oligopeptide transporter (OPT) family protein